MLLVMSTNNNVYENSPISVILGTNRIIIIYGMNVVQVITAPAALILQSIAISCTQQQKQSLRLTSYACCAVGLCYADAMQTNVNTESNIQKYTDDKALTHILLCLFIILMLLFRTSTRFPQTLASSHTITNTLPFDKHCLYI